MKDIAQDGFGTPDHFTFDELQIAARNHGMPLEALRYPITPVGLHYLLIHYDIPAVIPTEWRLDVTGAVNEDLTFDLDDLRAMTSTTVAATMECAGNGRARLERRPFSQPWINEAVGTAQWTGVPVSEVLDAAGVRDGAVEVVFTGLDRGLEGGVDGVEQVYERSLALDELRRPEVILAYEMNGEPLLPQHGAPLRLLVPGWYGMTNVKWLSRLTVVTEPFTGYQQSRSYRIRTTPDEPGTPVTRILPRALMIPPGIPDFGSRQRVLTPEPCTLTGRAWSGLAPIQNVEISTDGGETWHDAEVDAVDLGPWAWQEWRWHWEAPELGEHLLLCRAADAAGNDQASRPAWNLGGYTNPAPHEVRVTVKT